MVQFLSAASFMMFMSLRMFCPKSFAWCRAAWENSPPHLMMSCIFSSFPESLSKLGFIWTLVPGKSFLRSMTWMTRFKSSFAAPGSSSAFWAA